MDVSNPSVRGEPAAGGHAYRNQLLAALPPDELALIAPHLEPIPLARRQLMYDPERQITHVYFIEHGIASILSVLADGSAVETATIGSEGFIGLPIFHGVDVSVEQAMVQVPGDGYRVAADAFRTLILQMPTLSAKLHRFAVFLFSLAAQNSACNRKHAVEQRCARWLLIVHDRVEGDEIGLTHDFISQMLGVRRASVTETLIGMERQGLIRTGRGKIVVTDRAGLEALSCECYAITSAAGARLLDGRRAVGPLADVETSRDGVSVVGDGTPMAPNLDEPLLGGAAASEGATGR